MAASSRGGNAAASLFKIAAAPARPSSVCASCRISQTRTYSAASEAVTIAEAHHLKPTSGDPNPPVTTSRKQEYRLRSGMIVSRAPIITRKQTPFEDAFFFYQKRLNERLTLPFRHTLFFKKDTASDLDWRMKLKERDGIMAKELGRYRPQSRNAWNDELVLGSTLSSQDRVREILLADAASRVNEDGEPMRPSEVIPVEQPQPRETEADKKNDVRRLDRKLDRSLYLVVQKEDGEWQFPTVDMPTDEVVHQSAARALEAAAGVNMNTWTVGRTPVAHMVIHPEFSEDSALKKRGEKVFFLRSRIMAGQADLTGNKLGYKDFNWLTKDEVAGKLGEKYFRAVRNSMQER